MNKNENQENQQNETVKKTRLPIWKCAVSIALCLALVAVIVLGAVAVTANGKIAALRDELSGAKEATEALRAEIGALKNGQTSDFDDTAIMEALDALKNENQTLLQELQNLKDRFQDANEEKIRIYIDQGHNPVPFHNSGASGNGLYEHDLTFTIGCMLAAMLKADGRFEVCLSRPNKGVILGTDNASSQQSRLEGAEDFEADYLISLHVNSYTDGTAYGVEAYTTEGNATSLAFGESLLEGLAEATGLRDRGMKQNPDLYILKNATMPAALLEMGFISNVDDAALLAEKPELFAEGIYNGILAYFGLASRNVTAN